MEIYFTAALPDDADALIFVVGSKQWADFSTGLPSDNFIKAAANKARFAGKAGQSFASFVDHDGQPVKVLLVGAAGAKRRDLEKAGGDAIAQLQRSGTQHAALMPGLWSAAQRARIAFGAKLRSWCHEKYLTKQLENAKVTLRRVSVLDPADDVAPLWPDLQAVADGVALTRELVAEPANIIYPESFVERCQQLQAMGVEFTVLDRAAMTEFGMGALLGVSQGSAREPRLLAMRWDGTGGRQAKPLALIGKGVTFDTGGISIKPAAGMEEMKWDMGGAGAVAGTMLALAGRKARAHVVGICGLVENMPDGLAQRPGDVVTSMAGQTIEVINTDAEGRLVLCDAMHWAQVTFAPEVMIDLATLTGAMIISLGNEYAGCFANDDGLAEQLLAAGEASGDPLWRLPLSPAYDKLINSPIADIKNVGPRGAGSITAAQFLKRFVHDGVKWSHLDIAGMVWADKPGPVWDKGATGYGVRLLNELIAQHYELTD